MISGFLLVNKDPGISSSRVVQVLKKKLNLNKVGHLGTLDPMAMNSGALEIAVRIRHRLSRDNADKPRTQRTKRGVTCSTSTEAFQKIPEKPH